MIDHFSFLVGEALVTLRRNATMTLAAVMTVAVSLFLLGGLSYVYLRADEYAHSLTGRFEMRVFLVDGVSFAQVRQTAAEIRSIPGVAEVSWIPRDKAWARDQVRFPELTQGVENPYPDAFKVRLSDLHRGDEVARRIRSIATVLPSEGVQYEQDAQHFVDVSMHLLRAVGGTVSGLLFVAAGLLIYNAIRMTVLARRLEIRVMQLVGASRLTIQIPFLIEGILQGAIGGVVAGGLLGLANSGFTSFLQTQELPSGLPYFPFWPLTGILCAIGGAYGLMCSGVAIRSPLRFR